MPKKEDEALKLIAEAGSKGILQCELWERLKIDSGDASDIARKLERDGLVRRQRELHAGRWTYRLFATKKLVTLDSIIDCPCTVCLDMDKCSAGGDISPINCDRMARWLVKLVKQNEAGA
jgi:hypothetical protein